MEHYRAYKWAAVGFGCFCGFVGAVSYWSGPASVRRSLSRRHRLLRPGGALLRRPKWPGANVDIQPLLSSENELFLQGMIEQFSTRPAVGSGDRPLRRCVGHK